QEPAHHELRTRLERELYEPSVVDGRRLLRLDPACDHTPAIAGPSAGISLPLPERNDGASGPDYRACHAAAAFAIRLGEAVDSARRRARCAVVARRGR